MRELTIVLGVVLVLLQVGDILTTRYGLRHGAVELNPIARWAFRHLGFGGAAVIKMMIVAGVAWMWVDVNYPWALLGMVYLFCFICGWNLARARVRKESRIWEMTCPTISYKSQE